MRFKSFRKLLILLPIMFSTFFVAGQDTLFTYLFEDGLGSPCAPASVNFYPQSNLSNPIYDWKVNGISFSNQAEPIRIFPIGGTFNICLNLMDGAGASESYCEEIFIFDPPTIALDNDVDIGCSPLPVTFTLTSSTNIDSIVWDLGDGTVVGQNGNDLMSMTYDHIFFSSGNYSPIVTVFDENGCEIAITEMNAVEVIDTPTPSFTADATIGCTVPHTVNFTNNTAMSGSLSFYWDFGVDASSNSTDINPSYTYTVLGSYDVTLIVTNNNTLCTDTLVLEDFISIGEFNGFQYDLIDDGNCGLVQVAFSFYNSGNIQSVAWDFGDGNSSSNLNPVYTYTTAGCFTPSLAIVTTDGCNYTATSPDCINSNGSVNVDYTASGDLKTCDPIAGTAVTFNGISPMATSWFWDFGGLGTSIQQNPTFTFTGYGNYPVELTVTYSDGCTQSIIKTSIIIEPLQADFSSNVVDGCEDLQVFFYNETNAVDFITSYQWDFGGGIGLNSIANPVVNYPDTGSYDVSLIVETVSGCIDTIFMENYIQVGAPTNPGFSADPLVACLEDQIQFTDESGSLVDEWEWYFGDGGQSGEQDPQHEYTDTGFFDVTLITFFHGCPDTILIEDYIYINAPKAEFSFDQDCSMPGEIQFYDASAGAETWSWDFGDGQSSNLPNPSHTYPGNGSYLVTLTVNNSQTGCEHSQSMTVNVTTSIPEFTLSDLNICAGDTISVINNSIGADCYTWSFPSGVGMITNSFCDPDPQFYIPTPGCYYGFSLTITDGSTCSNTYYFPDTVCVSGAVADFAIDDADGCSPHTVNFTNSAYGVNSNVVNYSWDFGDTNTSTDPNPTHIYTDLGYYSVALTVENESGCTDELMMDSLIFVDKIDPFFIPQVTDCSSQSVDFANASTSYDNNLTYLWDFGDGNTSTVFSPSHSYGTTGDYLVCLTATNQIGCSEQICDNVNFQPLSADFSADNTYKSCPVPPLVSSFTDLSTNATSWSWDFGDGGANSGLQNPSRSYDQTGYYTVCLTVTNEIGCSATECKTDYIIVDGPSGTFTADVTSGCADLEVQFIVQSENAFKYTYDFGDGFVTDSLASGDSDTITYTYTNGGTYSPLVLVEDVSGCQIPVLGPSIYVEDILTDFAATINDVCEDANTPIDFIVAFADPSTVISVDWEFPGSNTPTAIGTNPTGIIYNQPGYYDVVVNANTTYCQTTVTKDSFIYVHPSPVTNFTVNPPSACNFETLSFEDQSSVPGDNIISWSWSVDNNVFTDTNFTYQFTSPGDYVVTLETTSGFGCVSSEQQTITIFENPQVDAGENVFLCKGENVEIFTTIQTSDPVNYLWSPASGLSCSDCPNPVADPTTTTQYFVTATSVNGCISNDSVLVEVSTLPELEIYVSPDVIICEGDNTNLTSSTNHTATSYNWDTSQPGLSCYNCADPVANPATTTTYTVTIVTSEGCSGSNSVTVEVIEEMDLIDVEPVICVGESTQLEVTVGNNITWTPSIGLSCTNCPNPVASPTSTITYTVTSLLQNQCIQTDEVTVSVLTDSDVDAGEDITVCEGFPVTLDGIYPSGTSEWIFNGQVLASNTPTPTITPTQTGYYILEVTNGNCTLSDTLIIEVRDKVEIIAEDVTICQGDTAFLFVTGDADTYEWIDSPGISDPTSNSPFVIPTETTIYTVIGSFGNCEPDVQLVTVEVLPLANINLLPIDYFSEGEEVQLDAGVTNGNNFTYAWSPPLGLSCTDCPNPTVSPEEDITYNLTVTNELGCFNTASIFLRKIFICNDDLIIVPNAFTPNGDGNNDRFNVRSELEIGMVRIYNRWGEIVFENIGGNQGWDGNYKGQKLNRDVFVYYIEATCEFNGKTIVKTGDITLIR